jgi:hypothetical protein
MLFITFITLHLLHMHLLHMHLLHMHAIKTELTISFKNVIHIPVQYPCNQITTQIILIGIIEVKEASVVCVSTSSACILSSLNLGTISFPTLLGY